MLVDHAYRMVSVHITEYRLDLDGDNRSTAVSVTVTAETALALADKLAVWAYLHREAAEHTHLADCPGCKRDHGGGYGEPHYHTPDCAACEKKAGGGMSEPSAGQVARLAARNGWTAEYTADVAQSAAQLLAMVREHKAAHPEYDDGTCGLSDCHYTVSHRHVEQSNGEAVYLDADRSTLKRPTP